MLPRALVDVRQKHQRKCVLEYIESSDQIHQVSFDEKCEKHDDVNQSQCQ